MELPYSNLNIILSILIINNNSSILFKSDLFTSLRTQVQQVTWCFPILFLIMLQGFSCNACIQLSLPFLIWILYLLQQFQLFLLFNVSIYFCLVLKLESFLQINDLSLPINTPLPRSNQRFTIVIFNLLLNLLFRFSMGHKVYWMILSHWLPSLLWIFYFCFLWTLLLLFVALRNVFRKRLL